MKRIIGMLILLFFMLTAFICSFIFVYESNKTYTISYFQDTSSNDSIDLVYKSNEEIHLIVNPYEKEGYRFKGWNINGKIYNEYSSYIMPDSDLSIIAEWVKIIHVTLEANNGEASTTLNIDQGQTLDYNDLPLPVKQGYLFEDWYLDNNLSIRYNAGVYKFNNDISLYAKYTTIVDNTRKDYLTSKKVLLNQKTNFNIEIYSDIELNDQNINTYINLSQISSNNNYEYIVSKLDNKKYNVKIKNNLEEGHNYILNSLNDNVYFLIEENSIKNIYNSLFISTTNPSKSEQIIKSDVLELNNNDYYYISNNEIFLKDSYVFNNEINKNQTVKINNNQSSQYAKIKDVVIRTINSNTESKDVCVLILESVSFIDIFENLKIADTKEININNYLNKNLIKEVEKEFTSTKEYNTLQNMYVDTIKKYLLNKTTSYNLSNEIVNNAKIDHSKTEIDVDITSKGFEIKSSFIVTLNEDIYFKINLNIIEELSVNLFSNLSIYNELTDFDIYTKVDSKSIIETDVTFYNKDEIINVKDDLNSLISTLDKNEFYNKYNEYLKYNTGKLNLLNLDLINIETNINEFININIPISIEINLGINSPLFSKFTINNSKIYGLKSTNQEVETYLFDNGSNSIFEASYNGHFNLEKGLNVGLDISFNGFDNFGNFGLNIYNGYNFDVYGSSNLSSKEHSVSSTSGYYYEVNENYNETIYINNPHLNKFNTYNKTNNMLLSTSGNQYIVFDFVNKIKDIKTIELVNGQVNLNDYNLFYLEELNLKTGKLENIIEDRNTFNIITTSYFDYDKESGILKIKDEFKSEDMMGTIVLRYTGNVYNSNKFIELMINVNYDSEKYLEDNQETETLVNVTYMIEDEIYYTEQVPYNSYHCADIVVRDEFYKNHPNYEYIYWNTTEIIQTPITKDTIFKANIVYKKIIVTYEYELLIDNEIKTSQERVVATCGVDKVKDLASNLVYFIPNVTDKCTFIKWEQNDEIIQYEANQVFKAIYNKQNLDVVLEISEVIVNNTVLLEKQTINLNIPYGTKPDFNYKTLSGFKLVFDEYNNEKLYKNTLIKASLIREKDYNIKFYDYYGNVLYETNAYLGENLYNLLTNTIILNYKYPVSISTNKQAILKGWTNSEKLKFINTNIELYPLFEITDITQKVIFNLNGAHFSNHYEYIENNGLIVNKGQIIDSTLLSNLIPIKESTDQYSYVFDGWYYGNTKVDLSTYQITRDTTFLARFKEVERTYSLEIYSNGFDSYMENGTYYEVEINGSFKNNTSIITGEDLTYNDIRKVLTSISNVQSDEYIPIAVDENYVFERYLISLEDSKYILIPLYKNNTYNTTIKYNYSISPTINNYEKANHLNLDVTKDITFNLLHSPVVENNKKVKYYNKTTTQVEEMYAAYYNDTHFYVFKGWSLDKEELLNDDSLIEYNQTIELFAIYEEYAILKQATFIVENSDEKILINSEEIENEYVISLNYNDSLPTDLTISAIKVQKDLNLYYTYQFIGWYCVESDTIVLNDFNDNYHYIARFEKVINA